MGLERLFGDLQAASQRMTPEMYQAATTTLFGSDAARLAGIAAKDGAAGYDQMRDAMEKQGSAAKLAAAQNQGLPGVIERLKNAAETLAITLFEKVQGPLSSIGDGLTGFTNKMQDAFENPAVSQAAGNIGAALSGIGAAFGRVLSAVGPALVAGLSNAVNLIVRFKDFLIPLVAGLVAYKTVMLAITVATKAWAAVQALLNIALTANPIGLITAAIAGLVAGIVVLYNRNETFRKIVQTTWAAIKTAISAVWNWLSTTVFPGLKLAFTAIGTAATWLWNNAIAPAWNGIKAVIGVAWEVVSDIFNNWVRVGQLVGQGAMWLWNNAIQPAWDGIKTAISAAWDFVSPILDKFSAGWDALKSGISSASSAIKDAVTSAFSGLAAVIKAPLKLLGTFLTSIPSEVFGFQIPGADKLNSWGKSLQGFSGGGLVRGPGSGTSDSILAWLSNGEGVVTAKGMKHGAGIVAALNSGWVPSPAYLADMMRAPGYAEGLNPGADYLRSLVMRMWPQIKSIGGRRSEDGYGEHSSGNAIDIMIPDYNTPQGMALGISAVWNWLSTTVFPGLKLAFTAIGTAATWLWNNAITPAWNGIKSVIGVAWEVVSDIFNNWVRVGQLVGQGAMWLWNNAIQPAWDGIKNAISAAWDFVSPILDKFSAGWDALKSGISSASSAIKDAVTSAFSGLAAVIKAPLKLLGTFLASIPSEVFGFQIPGADKLNSWGKSLQGFAAGGLVRGPGSGTSDSILAWLSNGEGVVTAKGMKHGAGIVAALNSGWVPSPAYLADMMRAPGYAEGLNPGADYLRSLVMRMWPQIKSIGGRRSEDGYGEHSSGNAIDIMIPDYNTPQGMALGNAIAAMLAKNASALNLNGFIWRQQSYGYGGSFTQGKQMPNRGDDNQNHMNHLHVILGSGRGSGAAAVGLPTSSISLPSGGSVSALGFGGSSGSGASSKQSREADDRITDLSNRLDVTEQELADLESNPKAKETTKQRKRDQVDKLKRDLQQAKDDRAALDLGGSSGGFGGGNNPYAKIMEGISEILPDFGGLADIGIGGLKESLRDQRRVGLRITHTR
ncbi:Putative phage tail tape measure protein TMP [Mycobacteroides abscessus]|nr:Putative phage tail tape measure protein TMP [Mycobacteroides abscessus]